MGIVRTSMRRRYDYFLVKPSAKGDVHRAARRLMKIERVREVVITEGDYGFIVKADFLYKEDAEVLNKKIAKVVGGSSSKAVCYCQYNRS